MIQYANLLPATNVARNIVAWNRTAFYSCNNVESIMSDSVIKPYVSNN